MIFTARAENSPSRFMRSERMIKTPELSIKETTIIELPQNFSYTFFDQLNEKIGPVYPSHSKVHHVKSSSASLIFETDYEIGDLGLRLHRSSTDQKKIKHLIVAGDSNVFGEGCSQKDTLPAQLEKFTSFSQYQIYNFGHRGGGPHNTLSLMEHYPYRKNIQEKEGLFLYQFFPAHMIERVIGGKNYTGWDQGRSPWYELNEKNELIYRGSFSNRNLTALYKKMAASEILNWLFPSLPRLSSSHLKLVAKVFEKMKAVYLRDFPQGKFVVVLNELTADIPKLTQELQKELKLVHVDSIILAAAPPSLEKMTFKDMHFNPEGQKWMAGLLADKF